MTACVTRKSRDFGPGDAAPEEQAGRTGHARAILAVSVAFALTWGLMRSPHQQAIAPLVESDYAYQLIAADRLFAGDGLTSLQPVAPNQPWAWHYDWGYLTQWPAGYPLLVCAVRAVGGGTSLEAAHLISAAACAFALVGWFMLVLQIVPDGVVRYALAAVAAGLSVKAATLIDPSTDAIVMAALPWLLLGVVRTVTSDKSTSQKAAGKSRTGWWRLALIGLAAGALFWIRYAAIFIPIGIGVFFALDAMWTRQRMWRDVLVYTMASLLPIVALIVTNRALSASNSLQSQLNLGTGVTFNITWGLLATAWMNLTDLGWYAYRPVVHQVLACWPVVLGIVCLVVPGVRRAMRRPQNRTALLLCVSLIGTLLVMLITATALFGGKYDYANLPRYYAPGRVLFCIVCFAPLVLWRSRVVRLGTCGVLALAFLWTVQVVWSRPLQRWHEADRPATPYGEWSRPFEPGASELYAWLRANADPSLIVVSNFHEYVTLEAGIPALPIPPDRATLNRWTHDIARARGIEHPTTLFVLDPDNRWRDYWIPKPKRIIESLDLHPAGCAGGAAGAYLFTPEPFRDERVAESPVNVSNVALRLGDAPARLPKCVIAGPSRHCAGPHGSN